MEKNQKNWNLPDDNAFFICSKFVYISLSLSPYAGQTLNFDLKKHTHNEQYAPRWPHIGLMEFERFTEWIRLTVLYNVTRFSLHNRLSSVCSLIAKHRYYL